MIRKLGLSYVIVFSLMLSSVAPVAAQSRQDSATTSSKIFSKTFLRHQIVPLSLIGAGVLAEELPFIKHGVQEGRNQAFPNFQTSVDNYLAVAAIGLNYSLDLFRVPARDNFLNQTLLLAKSGIVTYGVVQVLKKISNEQRPDHSDNESFPSGHTAVAFVAATFLDKEFRSVSPWISVAGYTMATATGALRVLNNKHWIGDVLAGAGIGMLTTNIIFATHQYRWGNKPDALSLHIIPVSFDGHPGFTASLSF